MKKIWFLLIFPAWALSSEHFFTKIKTRDYLHRTELAKIIHFDSIDGDIVYSVVKKEDLKILKRKFKKDLLQITKIDKSLKGLNKNGQFFPPGFEEYHNVDEVIEKLKTLEKNFPDLVKLMVIGKTYEKRNIYAARISAADPSLKLPGSLYIGSHHAREHLSTEVPLGIMEYLVKNFAGDPEINELLKTRETFFIPLLNPDGAIYDLKDGKFQFWRKNRSKGKGYFGTDLNRNYAAFWGSDKGASRRSGADTYGGKLPFSEAESKSLKKFIEERKNIRTIITYHSYGELILYPWGGKKGKAEGLDQKVFDTMGKKMALMNGYDPKPSHKLYLASGEFCDWAYGVHNIFCFTFELSPKGGKGFYPTPEIFEKTIQENIAPALYMVKMAKDPYQALKVD